MADRGQRTRRLLWIVLVVCLATSASLVIGFLRWWPWPERVPPLAPGWTAIVRVIAGDGVDGTVDGAAERARFSEPFGVAVAADGTIYVADAGHAHRIRRISPDGVVTTLAGGVRGFADGASGAARFDTPSALAIDASGTLYVADTGNNAIRKVSPSGVVSTLAGDGTAGSRDGDVTRSRFNGPIGIAVDQGGRIIVADTYNDRIRAITPAGQVVTLSGSGRVGAEDGSPTAASFDTPSGIAIDAAGSLYVADTGNDAVRLVSPLGSVTTLAVSVDGAGEEERYLRRPIGIATNGRTLFVTDAAARIVEVVPGGRSRVLAGTQPGYADGAGRTARFRNPTGVAVAGEGRVVVADAGNTLVREAGASSRLRLRPPPSPRIAPRFDSTTFGLTPLLWPVAPMAAAHEVAGTLGEARAASGGEGHGRFHAGIDVREPEGTPVLAVRGGVVQSPMATGSFGALNEWVSIGPATYVHLRVGRDRRNRLLDDSRFLPVFDERGALVRVRLKRGVRFHLGDVLGTVNRFYHVHLNVGWAGEEHNPLLFRLPGFSDSVPPTIARRGIRIADDGGVFADRLENGRLLVSGRVRIVVDAWDRVDGNPARRRLGVYRVGYQVLGRDGTPVAGYERPRETMRFDQLGPDPSAPTLVYAPGSGIPFYGNRVTRFLYQVTNTFRGGIAAAGVFDSTLLAPGDYTLRVLVADTQGNEAVANRDLPIRVVAAE